MRASLPGLLSWGLSLTSTRVFFQHNAQMSCRLETIARIQALSLEEGMRQPTAAAWLQEQDRKHRMSLRPGPAGVLRLSAILGRFPLVAF